MDKKIAIDIASQLLKIKAVTLSPKEPSLGLAALNHQFIQIIV